VRPDDSWPRSIFIDSHCHLNDPRFAGDADAVIDRAVAADVEKMLVVGYDLPSSEIAVDLAARNDCCLAAVGVHPHDARHYDAHARETLQSLAARQRVVAIGEIGLDYYYNTSEPAAQQRAFRDQLDLARELGLPVVLHCREAYDEVLDTLEAVGDGRWRGVLHCFGGDTQHAERGLGLGLHLGIAGVVTFRNADALREVVRATPLDRLLIETDAPYLAPEPHRGKRNEPSYVRYVAHRLAEVRGEPFERIAAATTANARDLFGGRLEPAGAQDDGQLPSAAAM